MRVLLLAGTREARTLCAKLARLPDLAVTASLAGTAATVEPYPVKTRRGGFGGVPGLVRCLRECDVNLLIDATHPFASRIAANACAAAMQTGIRYMRLARPPWSLLDISNVTQSESLAALFASLPSGASAFAPLGKSGNMGRIDSLIRSRPDVRFALRSIARPEAAIPHNVCEWILRRPPFSLEDELAVLRRQSADCLLCRNSGGKVSFTKIDAASQLGLKIFVQAQPLPHPLPPNGEAFTDTDALVHAVRRGLSKNRQSGGQDVK